MAKKKKTEHKKKQTRLIKRVVIIGVAVLVVAGLIVSGWLLVRNIVQQADTEEEVTREEELANIATEAERVAAESDDPDEAAAVYDEAIGNTDDDQEKSELLASKATAYFNAERYNEALEAAREADELHESAMVSALVAQIYEAQGNNQRAADYYNKAARLVDEDNPMSGSDRDYYNMKADELGGGE